MKSAPPPPQTIPQLASRPQPPAPPAAQQAESGTPPQPPTPKKGRKAKKAKQRAAAKDARAAAADDHAAGTDATTSGAGVEQLKAMTAQPQPTAKPNKPMKPAKQSEAVAVADAKPPAAPRSPRKAFPAAERPKAKASSDGGDAAQPQAPPNPAAPAAPAPPAAPVAAAGTRSEPQAETGKAAASDASDASELLSPAEAADLWAQRSAESDTAVAVSRPELRRGARGGRELAEAIEETLIAAGKAPPPRAPKAALPKKRRKAQRGAVMKTLNPEAMRELLTPSPVAAQQAQQAGVVMVRPRASPITAPAAPSGEQEGSDGSDVARDTVAAGGTMAAAAAAPGLRARPVQPPATPDSAEADTEEEGTHA